MESSNVAIINQQDEEVVNVIDHVWHPKFRDNVDEICPNLFISNFRPPDDLEKL